MLKMKQLIKLHLRENLQQADKYYFNNGKLAPEVREKILSITHGDVYTKLLADLYFYYNRGESNTQYDTNVYKLMTDFYNNIKNYNKGILPIQGNIMDYSIDKNDPWHITNLYSILDWRQMGVKALGKLPSVVIRNIKEIRNPIDSKYDMEKIGRNLRKLSDLINEMNLSEEKKGEIIGKIASSKETLETMVEIAQHFYDSLLQIEDTDIDEVLYEIGEQNAVLKQNKNNIVVVKIKDEEAAQALSCGTTWCFARPNSTEFWEEYAQMGYLYYIYDFNKEQTDALFLMTMIPSTYQVYAGTNIPVESLDIEDGMSYLASIGVNTGIFDKDYEKAMRPKKEKIKGDPNQLQFAFEGKHLIKLRLRENLEGQKIRLFHRVSNKKQNSLPELVRSVFTNGLIPYDNGEIGSVIWFSDTFGDYAQNGVFVMAYDLNPRDNKFEVHYDGHNGYGNKQIPFNELVVIKVPIINIHGTYFSNLDVIRYINDSNMTPETFNNISGEVTIFKDLFELYIQPNIKITNFMGQIDTNKIKVVNIL